MTLDISTILDRAVSHAMALGVFESVNTHEPKNSPGNGLTCAVWASTVEPAMTSGLDSTSVVVTLNVRLYTSMLTQPPDIIDPNLVSALDVLMAAYVGDFTLGGAVRQVDVRGAEGAKLAARAGYLDIDRKLYRVITINLPMIVNDLWEEDA
jgi:hypothetical protein